MRIYFLPLFVFISAVIHFGVSAGSVDVSLPITELPIPTSLSGATLAAASDFPHQPMLLKLDISFPPAGASDQGTYVRITNSSLVPLTIPTSRDGKTVFTKCPNHVVLRSFLSTQKLKAAPSESVLGAELFGCEAIAGTTVRLMPGDWLDLIHIPSRLVADRQKGSLTYVVSLDSYRETYAGFRLQSKQIATSRLVLQ